ncbi:MAG: hypothetical protein J7518_23415, partial [Nocardioidaceae bacterium]|nr:hypothetical protein [Nocardioidaceae bacterium]
MNRTRTLDEAAALAAVRRTRVERDAAEVRHFCEILDWCLLHVIDDPSDPDEAGATWGDSPVLLAGEGAPQVSEFCVYDLGAALGISLDAVRTLVGETLEIAFRLPRIWYRVQAGT